MADGAGFEGVGKNKRELGYGRFAQHRLRNLRRAGDGISVALLAAFEAQVRRGVAEEHKPAFGAGEADGVFEHGGEHIGPGAVLVEALGGLEEQGQRVQVGGSAAGGQFGVDAGLRELGEDRPGRVVGLVDLKQEGVVGRAQRDSVVGAQARGGDAHAVDIGAVAAAGVAHKKTIGVAIDECMRAGNLRADNAQIALRTPAQGERKMVDGDDGRRLVGLRLQPFESQPSFCAMSHSRCSLCTLARCGDYAEPAVVYRIVPLTCVCGRSEPGPRARIIGEMHGATKQVSPAMNEDPTIPIGALAGKQNIPAEQAEAPAVAATWGSFSLMARVGFGGFGEVYRAWDPHLQREVALKLLLPGVVTGEAEYEAMLREARALASVRHPNIVPVYGIDRHDGRVGFWTDFVRGKTLSVLVGEQGTFGAREAALIGLDVARALSAVHRAGMLHRDIKAENVMREEGGRILLMDFGLTALEQRQTNIAGTPNYMAPELFEGGRATVATDIYAMGVLLYFLVAGDYPARLSGLTTREALDAFPARRPLMDLRPDLPESLLRTVSTAMEMDPAKRFTSAGQLASALAESLGTHAPAEVSTAPEPRPEEEQAAASGSYAVAVWQWRCWPVTWSGRDNLQQVAAPQRTVPTRRCRARAMTNLQKHRTCCCVRTRNRTSPRR